MEPASQLLIKFRRTVPEDLPTIERFVELDPAHKGTDASFWITTGKGISCYVIEDGQGPIIFVRQEATSEEVTTLHTQFANCGRKKIFSALKEAYPLVANDARERGFKKVGFESASPALIRTMLDMGFRAELIADL
jgi:hypothetical protein